MNQGPHGVRLGMMVPVLRCWLSTYHRSDEMVPQGRTCSRAPRRALGFLTLSFLGCILDP